MITTSPIIEVHDLPVLRGGRRILEPVDLAFGSGVTAVLGPNGAGKSSLFETLLSREAVCSGQVCLGGIVSQTPRALRQFYARVGFMPQHWQFMSSFTVAESVAYAAWLKGVPQREIRTAAREALTSVDLSDRARMKVGRLSGGMRQRVGLAETFVARPRVALLDEPTVGLDPAQRADFRRFVRQRAEDCAVIVSTHLTDDVVAIADRVLVVAHGAVQFDGTASELSARGRDRADFATALEAGYLAVVNGATDAS